MSKSATSSPNNPRDIHRFLPDNPRNTYRFSWHNPRGFKKIELPVNTFDSNLLPTPRGIMDDKHVIDHQGARIY